MKATSSIFEAIKHVCFDKDGTLIDVHAYWAHTCALRARHIARALGLAQTTECGLLEAMGIDVATTKIKLGGPVGYSARPIVIDAVRRQLKQIGLPTGSDKIEIMFQEVDAEQQRANDYRIEALPGVREALRALSSAGIVISIYSSDRVRNTERVLAQLGLNREIREIVGGDSNIQPKPNPEGFLLACRRLDIPAAASAYVGDTTGDLEMSQACRAGRAIGVATGLDTFEALAAISPYSYHGLDEFAHV